MASSACPPASDRGFGPRVHSSCRSLDFTIFFEDVFFACVPTAVFILLAPFHVRFLLRSPAVCSVRSKLLSGKLSGLAGVFAAYLALLILRSQHAVVRTSASWAADVLGLFGIAGGAWLSYVDHQRSLRHSTLLSLYLSVLAILDLARVRTLWLVGGAAAEAAAMTVALALIVIILVIETPRKQTHVKHERRPHAPEEYCGFWIRTTFAWLAATFRAGYAKVMNLDDLPNLDTKLQSHVLLENLTKVWKKYDQQARHSLLKATFHANLLSFCSGILPRLGKTLFTFSQPLLVNATIIYVTDASADMSFSKALIGGWAVVYIGIACSTALSSYQTTRFVTRVKGGLIGFVYQQTMEIRTADAGEITAIALMGTDIERIGQNFQSIHEIWASVIEIGLAILLLERQVSFASLAPMAVIGVSIGATAFMSKIAGKVQVLWIEKVQERLRITSTVLGDMKSVKMLGLSDVITQMIKTFRQVEIKTSERFRKLLVINVLLSESPQNLSLLATFSIYVLIALYSKNASLLTAQAFTAVSLISLLTTPVIQLVQLMPKLLQCVGSFERIREYCNYAGDAAEGEELEGLEDPVGPSISLRPIPPMPTARDQKDTPLRNSIVLQNQSFAWERSKEAFLKNIDLNVPAGTLTAVVGPVGSGKSMLLKSILRETVSVSSTGTPICSSTIGYCAQSPWLESGTIQSNIVGISSFDANWYKTVTSACGLDADLQALEKGDKTAVGSKGLNLSGGQKQRIALARAVYSRTNIVILDDVFSGMDAHTIDVTSQRLFGCDGLFRKYGTTVILATHSRKLTSIADAVVVLESGRVIETINPRELLSPETESTKFGISVQDENSITRSTQAPLIFEPGCVVSDVLFTSTGEAIPDTRRKNGDWSVYRYYLSSTGYKTLGLFIITMAAWAFLTEFSTVWLDWWSAANEIEPNENLGYYLGVYAFICIAAVIAVSVSCWISIINIISNSALNLHSDLLDTTMNAPLRFFTSTDTGSLTNRFSQDFELIDMNLPLLMINYVSTGSFAVVKAIILIIFSKYLAAVTPVILVVLYFLQSFYLQTSRQVRLLEIEAKAPLYTHFIESVVGAPTVRAFGWQSQYQARNCKLIDRAQCPAYLQYCIQHWLGFVLNILVAIIAVGLVTTVVTLKEKFSGGNVGVSLVMIMTFSSVLAKLIQTLTLMESSIGAVARVKNFVADTESEEKTGFKAKVPRDWPSRGYIQLKSLVAAHSAGAEPVIKGVTLSIRPAEHVALCGRSGSGKTGSSEILSH
ncbi:ABC transporter [Xylariaceae sp. FL0255]|nr:ABC transporter [Xylariaceae sp. FL0255]